MKAINKTTYKFPWRYNFCKQLLHYGDGTCELCVWCMPFSPIQIHTSTPFRQTGHITVIKNLSDARYKVFRISCLGSSMYVGGCVCVCVNVHVFECCFRKKRWNGCTHQFLSQNAIAYFFGPHINSHQKDNMPLCIRHVHIQIHTK